RQPDPVSWTSVLQASRSDRQLQSPHARGRARPAHGPRRLAPERGLSPLQPTHAEPGGLDRARAGLLYPANRRLRRGLDPAVPAQAEPAVRAGRTVLPDPLRIAGGPHRAARPTLRVPAHAAHRLPRGGRNRHPDRDPGAAVSRLARGTAAMTDTLQHVIPPPAIETVAAERSEERRVGKECRCEWSEKH